MKIKSAEFLTSAIQRNQYPSTTFPEIAFLGRSNVGKSSLINALINRKRLVKTSSTPGRTRLINFFLVNNMLLLVDLPGYGFARVPSNIRKTWKFMIEDYLKNRMALKASVLVLDIRREPSDKEFMLIEWLNSYQIPIILALTKTDKLSNNKLLKQVEMISDKFKCSKSKLIIFSAKTKNGVQTIWLSIDNFLKDQNPWP